MQTIRILAFGVLAAWLFLVVAVSLILLVGGVSVKFEVDRRKSYLLELDQLSQAIASAADKHGAYEKLAHKARNGSGWDRVAAYAEIKAIAHLIASNPVGKTPFERHLMPALQVGLSDSDPYVREQAARAACEYGGLISPIQQTLMEVARRYPNQGCSWFSVRAIGNIGPQAAHLVPPLNGLSSNPMLEAEVKVAMMKLTAHANEAAELNH